MSRSRARPAPPRGLATLAGVAVVAALALAPGRAPTAAPSPRDAPPKAAQGEGAVRVPAPTAPAQAPESPEAIVQRQLDAYNARDIEAFLATFAPDAEGFRHPAQPFFSGHAEMRAIYGPVFAGIPDLHSELVARLVLGDHVFDQERVTGGGRQTVEAVAIYQVEGGLIRRVWFVTPTAPAAAP